MHKSLLAVCIAAVISAPTFAGNDFDLDKESDTESDIKYSGEVNVGGKVRVNSLGLSMVENDQDNDENAVDNIFHNNVSAITGNSFTNATGNIGINTAAGDLNMQSNSAALAAIDKDFSFSSGESAIDTDQKLDDLVTLNRGSVDSTRIGGASFQGVSGNIGVNTASGDNNIQANNFSATIYTGSMAHATVANEQDIDDSDVTNRSTFEQKAKRVRVNLDIEASGDYDGRSKRINKPNRKFKESGDLELMGTVTGKIPLITERVAVQSLNDASIGGSAFQDASGNIGVNVAAGSGNLQANSLALSYSNRLTN